MGISKVARSDGKVLIDLTADTAVAGKVLIGYKFHGADGEIYTGTCSFDMDTSGATAKASELLYGKTAGVNGQMVTGDMPNNGAVAIGIATKTQEYVVPLGFHDGSGKVRIAPAEAAKIIAGNIKSGVQILGVTGTYGGESVSAQAKTATPGWTQQVITPDEGTDYLSQVTVAAIPYTETSNAAGGTTVTIG